MTLRERDVEADIAIVESKISYLQPMQDEIVAECTLPDPDTVDRFIATYRQRGKARWELKAVISAIRNPAVEFRGAMGLVDPVEDTPTEQPAGLYFPPRKAEIAAMLHGATPALRDKRTGNASHP
jgi:hypothetical protein